MPTKDVTMLEKEFAYFRDHQQDLYSIYPDKYLLIKNKEVVGVADCIADALDLAEDKDLQPGTYLLQFCGKDEWAYTQVFHSRVKFS